MRTVGHRTFSVVVCTLDRADSLAGLFPALKHLTHPAFEVIVVPGPCTDHTDELLAEWSDTITVVRNPDHNLSLGRNLGIAEATGEIVAFIDDDGIPEPSWLDELEVAYTDDEVAGAGGVVRDHTGVAFQCRFNSADRLGRSDSSSDLPLDDLCFPGTWQFPYLIGTNSSFRRDRLIEVGGFDEEFEFYLDETDVCLRLIDAGYVLRQLPGAEVHHKFMPSVRRTRERVTVDLFAVVKNKIYFSLVNGVGTRPVDEILADDSRFAAELRLDLGAHAEGGRISDEELSFGLARIDDAWSVGLAAGFRGRKSMLQAPPVGSRGLHTFPAIPTPSPRLHVAFVSQTIPPEDTGGIGRYMLDTARGLAARGHEIRLITTGADHDTVDLEDGVWIHRITKQTAVAAPEEFQAAPKRIWDNAAAVAAEVRRLHERRPLDAVLGAMWDVETLGLLDGGVPVITTLVTTLGITLDTKPEWRVDPGFMAEFVEPMLELERLTMERSDLVHAISGAVLEEALSVSEASIDSSKVVVAPLGVPDHLGPRVAATAPEPTVLFVGRLEKRKGIDLLLRAAPRILRSHPTARLVVIGRDDIPGETGRTPRRDFEEAHAGAPWLERVEFMGVVSDEELWAAYRDCSVFVAPSRFESFGLVYVEAMMASRPVVAVDLGAAQEVVLHGETGLLVAPDADSLEGAVCELLDDPARAAALGASGRRRFLAKYTVEAMVDSTEDYLGRLLAKRA